MKSSFTRYFALSLLMNTRTTLRILKVLAVYQVWSICSDDRPESFPPLGKCEVLWK